MLHCSICDGELPLLGVLGHLTHLRCRNCGAAASIEKAETPMAEASCYTCDGQLTEKEHGGSDGNCTACFEE